MDFHVIIPVRYASTRLPGKALLDIAGKPMIQHVYERSLQSGATSVVVATDDDRIAEVAESFGARVCMTAESHASGTERIAEAVEALELDSNDIVVGVQGDEPLLPPKVIAKLAEDLEKHDSVKVASVCEPITDPDELFNPHITKVVLTRRGFAMYFSRSPIPWERDNFGDDVYKDGVKVKELKGNHFRHVGLYAYRASFLANYIEWEPSPNENFECLEQLRIIWNGKKIHMMVTDQHVPAGVDTEEDLQRVREILV